MVALSRPDGVAAQAFSDRVLNDTSAAVVTILAAMGDRLGLFQDLADQGPATSRELARRTDTHERYVREWLAAMACAGYLRYHPEGRKFSLPSEHIPTLAGENGCLFLGGLQQMLPPLVGAFDRLADAFRSGQGIAHEDFDEKLWEGMERLSATWFENLLVPFWIPAMPEVEKKLRRGAAVADVGCGRGRAMIKLAKAYPKGRYEGFDSFGPAAALARKNAWIAGVADRVRFEWHDAAEGLPGRFDVITTFDVLHDTARPLDVLKKIREALEPDGIYVCLEVNASEKLEENSGSLGALFYGMSALFCTATVLDEAGDALGAMGLSDPRLKAMCREAGFRNVRRVPVEDAFHALYEIRP